MGCECNKQPEERDLYTSREIKEDLKLSSLYLPEEEQIQFDTIPLELTLQIKKKFQKQNSLPIKFYPIAPEEFESILFTNSNAKKLIELYTPEIDQINYEVDAKYINIPPIRVLDLDGGSQYYQGGFNTKGECHGKGIWIKDYDIYIGNFKNDQFYGKGLFISQNGDYYFGQWKNSMCEGEGNLTVKNKFVNKGNFKNGKKEGFGEEKYSNGDMYKGGFYDGEKSGRGQYIFADGSRYDGNFKNNKFNGFGQISLKNGDFIRGQFKDGQLNGEGDVNWNDGNKFVGNFLNDKKYGRGTYIWNDGQVYKETMDNDNFNFNENNNNIINENLNENDNESVELNIE